ncbi:MAG: sugar transferase [candidate division WOR-3 bacterium]|nr:sugar transferase [candidate division WOR-3 bacterium]
MSDLQVFKRIFDIISSVLLLLAVMPLILIIALVLLITQGRPIFFIQKRIGKDGRHFDLLKFRTMIVNAIDKGDGIFIKDNDTRITGPGYILRRYSLDELPQLFNVIKGDMSVVGPRPPLTYYPYRYEDYPEKYSARFRVKPGLTGLAQINGRNNIQWEERFVYDIDYVSNGSFHHDIIILLKSVYKVLKKEDIFI